jgi:glycosyltransferase involved in cell wall biosynthesis
MKHTISIILPVYNCAEFLHESIHCVLSQSFTDFELLVIDDGSTDDTASIIHSFTDLRIRYFRNEVNMGLIYSLNKGLSLANGKYIARMDGDDTITNDRLQVQYEFMEKNPLVDIAGSWYVTSDTMQICRVDCSPEQCRVRLLENPPLAHPSVIMLTESLRKHNLIYQSDYIHAEDYFLWAEASTKGLTIVNIPKTLLIYRIHNQQISAQKKSIQDEVTNKIRLWYASFYFKPVIERYQNVFIKFMTEQIESYSGFLQIYNLSNLLKKYNKKTGFFHQGYLETFLDEKINRIVLSMFRNKAFNWKIIDIPFLLFDSRFYKMTDTIRKKRILRKAISF